MSFATNNYEAVHTRTTHKVREYGIMFMVSLDVLDDDSYWKVAQGLIEERFRRDTAGMIMVYGPRKHVDYEDRTWITPMDYNDEGDYVETGEPGYWRNPVLNIRWYWRAVNPAESEPEEKS